MGEAPVIPKILHSCWFGKREKSDLFRRCRESWNEYAGDWQIVEWNESNILHQCNFFRSVMERDEPVKGADFARLIGVYRMGGVYLDMDIELVAPLSKVLDEGRDHFFVKQKDGMVNSAVFGATPQNEIVKQLVSNFPSREDGSQWTSVDLGPRYFTKTLRQVRINCLPTESFYPYDFTEPDPGHYGQSTIGVHRWAGSWKT